MLHKNMSLGGKLAAYQESGHVTKTTKMGKDERCDMQRKKGAAEGERSRSSAAVVTLTCWVFTTRLSIEKE